MTESGESVAVRHCTVCNTEPAAARCLRSLSHFVDALAATSLAINTSWGHDREPEIGIAPIRRVGYPLRPRRMCDQHGQSVIAERRRVN